MTSNLRKTGISVIPEVPWGTHFCFFYESQRNLLDILTPFVRAGLEDGEFCLLLTEERFKPDDVARALRNAIPDFERYVASQAIEIVPAEDIYNEGDLFKPSKALHYFQEKLQDALARGFVGLRGNGDEAWLDRERWNAFSDYERSLTDFMEGSNMIILCAYPMATSGAAEILDVAQAHEFVVAKRGQDWEVLETAGLKQTKEELKALSEKLEHRVAYRTRQLQDTNDQLRTEIIQRKQVEDELSEKEARYRRIFEISSDVIVLQDVTGQILDINPRGAQITGFTREELRGMNARRDLVAPPDRVMIGHVLEQVHKGRTQKYEVRWKTKNGRIVHFDGISVALRSADGKSISTFCSLRDVTERKQAERALVESEERFAKAFRSSPISNAITRDADGRFIDVNDAFVRLFGYQREELIGRTALELNMYVDPAARALLIDRLNERGAVKGLEARSRTKSGEILDVALFADIIEIGGQKCRLTSTYDRTESKQAEQALRDASEQLTALSRRLVEIQEAERRRLARELHDRVGQDLTALGINLNIVTARLVGRGDREVSSRLEDSMVLVESTADAIVNVLSELRPPMLDDLGLLPALEWYAKAFSTRTAINVSVAVAGESQPRRQSPAAEIALFRIAQEALNNVAKHAHARQVDIELAANGEFVLSISDDGVGLAPDLEPESRSSARLGVVTMRERALAIGGRFEIRRRPGGGTSVVVRIPSA